MGRFSKEIDRCGISVPYTERIIWLA